MKIIPFHIFYLLLLRYLINNLLSYVRKVLNVSLLIPFKLSIILSLEIKYKLNSALLLQTRAKVVHKNVKLDVKEVVTFHDL